MVRPRINPRLVRKKWLKIRVNPAEALAFKRRLGHGFSTKIRNRTLKGK